MYKLLLCLRYLRTRWIAIASIVSVTLGVMTMIVVNAVMAGFSHEMQNRIHGILSDIVFESVSLNGFPNPEYVTDEIKRIAGDEIVGTSTTVVIPGMLSIRGGGGQSITKQVTVIGIDELTQDNVSDFGKYLQHPANREQLSFLLRENGFDTVDSKTGEEIPGRHILRDSGWERRRWQAERAAQFERFNQPVEEVAVEEPAAPAVHNPFDALPAAAEQVFDPGTQQHSGIVLGIALVSGRYADGSDWFIALPGDDVQITIPTAGLPPKGVSENFTVVDFYESKMTEYDSNFVFVPIHKLQELRGMFEPRTGVRYATNIQIKLKPGADLNQVRDKLIRAVRDDGSPVFSEREYMISTWRDKQSALLTAVELEAAVLNVLLFLIIAVAGFGIFAIFYMIVVEKIRDIGILKSLGASSRGIMGIFLGYGLSLGCVGAGAGMVAGLLFVRYINEIRRGLEWMRGKPVFDPSIYYFHEIPTIVNPTTVVWIVIGALLIAVGASIFPALRAAKLHPVEALRV